MTPHDHQQTWFGEMVMTWALAGGGVVVGLGHFLQGVLALLAVSASGVSAYVGLRRFLWEQADRADRFGDHRREVTEHVADRADRASDRADRATERATDRAERATDRAEARDNAPPGVPRP